MFYIKIRLSRLRSYLYEIFIVFGKREITKLINQLNDADNITRRIFYGHTEDGFVLETGAFVHSRIESGVFFGLCYIDGLL